MNCRLHLAAPSADTIRVNWLSERAVKEAMNALSYCYAKGMITVTEYLRGFRRCVNALAAIKRRVVLN